MATLLGRAMARRLRPTCRRLSPARAPFCSEGDGFQSSRVKIFDRELKRIQRDRAAWLMRGKDELVDSVAENLLDRLEDCRKAFPTALCLGGSSEAIRHHLRGRGGLEKLIMMDMSYDMVKMLKETEKNLPDYNLETFYVVGDEEFLPIKEKYAYLLSEEQCAHNETTSFAL